MLTTCHYLEFERRAIEATAIAQEQLQCPVSFHPGRDAEAPFEIVRLYLEAGGKAEKCVMSHLDSKDAQKRATIANIFNSLLYRNDIRFYEIAGIRRAGCVLSI